jgi:hypothetical protein
MAYFARVVGGPVVRVHVLADPVITDNDGVGQETLGQEFLANLWGYAPAELVQCFDGGEMRGMYPAIGYLYDETLDAFLPPKPDGDYVWDEQAGEWVEA